MPWVVKEGRDRLNFATGEWILHITTRAAWEAAHQSGAYQADTLDSEGFIHCSTPNQVLQVANLFFQESSDLLLLWINLRQLKSPVKWEAVADQVFPHVYGPINLDAVEKVSIFSSDSDGVFRSLPGL